MELTPTESGSYRIRANFVRSKNESTATDRQIWATGGGAVYWGWRDDDRLEIKLDKDSYKPGETATVLIQSPYEEGELYFAIIRDRPIYRQVADYRIQTDEKPPQDIAADVAEFVRSRL